MWITEKKQLLLFEYASPASLFSKLILINAIPDKLRFGLSQWEHARRIMTPSWDFLSLLCCASARRSQTDIPVVTDCWIILSYAPNEGHVLCFPVCPAVILRRHRWQSQIPWFGKVAVTFWHFNAQLRTVCVGYFLVQPLEAGCTLERTEQLQFTNGSNMQLASC